MKRLLVIAVALLTGCGTRHEVVPTDALVQKWTWERVVEIKNHYCPTCNTKKP